MPLSNFLSLFLVPPSLHIHSALSQSFSCPQLQPQQLEEVLRSVQLSLWLFAQHKDLYMWYMM